MYSIFQEKKHYFDQFTDFERFLTPNDFFYSEKLRKYCYEI